MAKKLKLNFRCAKNCKSKCGSCIVKGIFDGTFLLFSIKDRKEWISQRVWHHPLNKTFYDGKLLWKKLKKFKKECRNCQHFKKGNCFYGNIPKKGKGRCGEWNYRMNEEEVN